MLALIIALALAPAASPQAPVPAVAPPVVAPPDGPAASLAWLNAERARAGVPPVAWSAPLADWAALNNARQRASGLGHFAAGRCCVRLGSASGTPAGVYAAWLADPSNRSVLLDPALKLFGMAHDGAYASYRGQ